jgi:hypothetical protein
MNDKVARTHLDRHAAVYLRQSTLKQVHEHRESTARQYALTARATAMGWDAARVQTIDEDLGQSGASTQRRSDFQRLAENIAHGRVGAIFALEVSRLARSSADWHRLLELCGLADVVIVDEQAVYSSRDFNDRLLLGLKGTMSEAELSEDQRLPGRDPAQLVGVDRPGGHLQAVLGEVAADPIGAAVQAETREDQPYRALHLLVGIEAKAPSGGVPLVPGRRNEEQLTPPGLVELAALQTQAHPVPAP